MKNFKLWIYPIGMMAIWMFATAYTIAGAPV